VLILAQAGISILSACHSAGPAQVFAEAPEFVAAGSIDGFDYEQAADQMAFRWEAIAKGYEKLSMLNTSSDPGDASA